VFHVRFYRSAAAALLLACTAAPAFAQGLDESLSSLAAANAEMYVRPVSTGLGHALGAGFVETARPHRLLGFDLGVRVMGAWPIESQKTFTAIAPESVQFNGSTFSNPYAPRHGNATSPTAVGSGPGVVFEPQGSYRAALLASGRNPEDYNLEFPEGLDIPIVPFALLQASVGLPYSTEVTFRVVPTVTPDEEIGAIQATGYGVKHTVSRWFPMVPVDVALFLGRQSFSVGDYLEATATTAGVIASRSLGPLTAFGQVRHSSADVSVGYTVDNPDNDPGLPADGTRIGFDTPVPGGMHAGAGLTLRFIGLGITGEYSAGPQRTASIKAGLSIR
jgi:hypothetical protein